MTTGDVGGGADAQAGLDYQVDVSIWFALDLVMARRLADSLELEPASQDDLEADLDDDEPGAVVSQSTLSSGAGAYRLVVQAKLRGGDSWRVSDINRLLQHGTRRMCPADRLADPQIRYLLVTSAALDGRAKALRVHKPAVWPQAQLPADTAAILPDDALGRVAVLSNYEPDRVETKIKELLTEAFRVPFAQWQRCLEALRAGAISRVRRQGTNVWTRADLAAIIVQHEGYLASLPELDDFVRPTNWSALRKLIDERHAAMIVGQSGTGKTLSTDMLYEELSGAIPGLRRKRILTPEDIRHYTDPGPVMFDIEDPWGRYSYERSGRDWVDQLHGFMASARADRIVVATSRLDVGRDAKALGKLEPWIFPLESEHYGVAERRLLYGRRVERLHSHAVRLLASDAEKRVLDELQTPLEIQKFFDALRLTDPAQARDEPGAVIREAVAQAHENSIETTIAQQIEARDDVKAATVLWGLLLDRQSISFEDLGILEDGLARLDPAMERGVAPLANFLVAARNFRQKDNLLSIYHGRDEKGLLNAINGHGLAVRRILGRLLDLLTTIPLADGQVHVERAAALLAATKTKPGLGFQPSAEAQQAIDAWLTSVLAVPGQDLDKQLRLAAAIGSPTLVEAEIANWLHHRPDRRDMIFMMTWGPPAHDQDWYARMAACPRTKPLLERFIRESLAFARDHYPFDFIPEADRLASGLVPAYADGALEAVNYGVLRSEDTLFAGAFRDIDDCRRVLDRAIDVQTPSPTEEADWAEKWLAMENGEFSPGYMESLGDDDDGYSASVFIRAYAREVRTQRGWQALRDHPQREHLLTDWLRALQADSAALGAGELQALQPIVAGTESEADFWSVANRHWSPDLETALVDRIRAGSAFLPAIVAAVGCLLDHAPARLAGIATSLVADHREGQVGDLAIALSIAGRQGGRPDPATLGLPQLVVDIAALQKTLGALETPVIDLRVAQQIAAITAESEAFRHFRTELAITGGIAVRDDVEWLLGHTRDRHFAVDAVTCAVAQGWNDIILDATRHRFADAAAVALKALSPPPPAPLPPEVLDKLALPGRPVRKAFLDLLEPRLTADAIAPLVVLAADRLSNQDYHDNHNSLPIARRAVTALGAHPDLGTADAATLIDVARTTDDPVLRGLITDLLASRELLQPQLLEAATTRGPGAMREAAIWSLVGSGHLSDGLIASITSDLIMEQPDRIAVALVLILGWVGSTEQVRVLTAALSAAPRRRVFLIALAQARLSFDEDEARAIANHLPAGHAAQRWAMGENREAIDEDVLAEFGSVKAVAAVLPVVRLKA